MMDAKNQPGLPKGVWLKKKNGLDWELQRRNQKLAGVQMHRNYSAQEQGVVWWAPNRRATRNRNKAQDTDQNTIGIGKQDNLTKWIVLQRLQGNQ